MILQNKILSILEEIENKAEDVISQNLTLDLGSPIYGAAFWLFYFDYTIISPPQLSVNTIRSLSASSSQCGSLKWSPAEWPQTPQCDLFETELSPIYSKLTASLNDEPASVWDKAFNKQLQIYSSLSKKITQQAGNGEFKNWSVTKDFITACIEEREDEPFYTNLLKSSVEDHDFLRQEGLIPS